MKIYEEKKQDDMDQYLDQYVIHIYSAMVL